MSKIQEANELTSLGDLLVSAAQRAPNDAALIFPDHTHTYRSLVEATYAMAGRLVGLGVKPGDHVGILMPNCPEYIEILMGTVLIGAISVPINARYKAEELAYVVENADLVGIVTSDLASEYVDFAGLLQEAFVDLDAAQDPMALNLARAPLLAFVATIGESTPAGFLSLKEAGTEVSRTRLDALRGDVGLSDPCIMMYTSGTTANPKGCPLSHAALVRNGINMNRERYFLSSEDRFWAPLPMFHIASILPFVCCLDAGAAMLSMNHIEAGAALQMMEREGATVAFPAFPTVTNELISHPDFANTDLSKLRRINNVAPVEVLRRFQEAFPQAVQTGAYGLTEASGVVSFNHPDEDLETRLHTCGQPFSGIEVLIVDPDTLDVLSPNTRGEIWVRGYCLFEGYYKSPEKNAESMVDGWLRTGDLCSLDEDNRITYHGRIKDMLKVGGENVAAVEIESFLATHPAVKLAQVVGVPDERLLEVAAAFIETEPDRQVTEAEIIEFCRGKIASFKVPRYVRFIDEWPMSSTKVQKFRLQEMFDPG
ncbi:MAG: AMP-binding protein [Gammaproteobacteria bacterium]|nr:AMP-binding protein [Gammaproteobacteria bacterium]